MALFTGSTLSTKYPRSNTKLVVSGGMSPAEKWIVKKDLPKLFDYPYGDAGQTEVVVSKGMMVGLTGKLIRDYDTGRYIPELTIASRTVPAIGMAPYNFAPQVDDRLTGNQPSIITREYVELPYIPAEADAANVLWGLVHGTGVKPGDYLKVSPALDGKLTKWDSANDDSRLIVAQVLGMEDNGAPNSWLEWAMWDDSAKKEDDAYINKSGVAAPSDAGYPYDPEYKALGGTQDMTNYLSQYTTQPTGLPTITNGDQIKDTLFSGKEIGIVPANSAAGSVFTFVAPQKYLTAGTVKVYAGGVEITDADVLYTKAVDLKNGFVTVTLKGAGAGIDTIVTMDYKAAQYGTPAYWNFKGSVGAVRLLLKF